MNDLMSGGLHRLWKRFTVQIAGVRAGGPVLDLAGNGDLARLFAPAVGPTSHVVLSDINYAMLAEGRDKLLDRGLALPIVQCNPGGAALPISSFDAVWMGFGPGNVTGEAALAEMRRVLKARWRRAGVSFFPIWAPLRPGLGTRCRSVLTRNWHLVAKDNRRVSRYLREDRNPRAPNQV